MESAKKGRRKYGMTYNWYSGQHNERGVQVKHFTHNDLFVFDHEGEIMHRNKINIDKVIQEMSHSGFTENMVSLIPYRMIDHR